MDLHRLEIFCKVAELQSFTLAAEALGLSQPTVSEHIRSLEEMAGDRLVERLGRELRLTPAGQILRRYALKLLALRDEAIQALARAARGSLARVHGRLAEVREKLAWLSPAARLGRLQHEIDTARRHMAAWGNEHVQRQSRTLGTFEGRLRTWAERQIRQTHEQLQTATHDLKRAGRALYQAKAHTLAVACARLQALNPRAPLERGFALVHRENGLVRSTAQVHPGMRLTVELMDGSFGVQVEEV